MNTLKILGIIPRKTAPGKSALFLFALMLVSIAHAAPPKSATKKATHRESVPPLPAAVGTPDALKRYKAALAKGEKQSEERTAEKNEEKEEIETEYLDALKDYLIRRTPPGGAIDWDSFRQAAAQRTKMKPALYRAAPEGRLNGLPSVESLSATARWQFVGPHNYTSPALPRMGPVSGRINAIAWHPTDARVIYIGAAKGGVWKSVDGGIHWTPRSDDWSLMDVSAIVLDPRNPQTVYVGTGDFPGATQRSMGIMKSSNGGGTWRNITRPEWAGSTISKIVMDPDNANTLYALVTRRDAVRAGTVWRSRNGGDTWTLSATTFGQLSNIVFSGRRADGGRWLYLVGYQYYGVTLRSGDRGTRGRECRFRSAGGGNIWMSLCRRLTRNDCMHSRPGRRAGFCGATTTVNIGRG